ncbi:MAG TPA: sugar ABC transporter permease [Roseiflexaceae bacterium]|nr:sugar ABC transporter permease [Roseiflexaceae bacterium]
MAAARSLPRQKARRFSILPEGKMERREAIWFWFFISPWVLGFVIFTLGPIVASAYLSLTRYNLASSPVFIGFTNYANLFNDRIFWKSLQVTAYYSALALPLGICLSLLLAVLLNQKIPFVGVFRTLFYLPSLLGASVAVVLLFQWLLNSQFGIVNQVIRGLVGPNGMIPLGITGPKWFQDPNWTVPSLVLMSLWGFGGSMLVYLSALQGVPTQLYEAATIDGAGRIRQFFTITLPMISGVILFTFITGVIGSFQVFTQAYIISNGSGSPAYSLMFYVLYLFNNAFRTYRMGTAAAQAWILFLIVLVLTLLLFRVSRRFVYYESDEEGFL